MTDDLFQPSLTSNDDRHGFQNPWNPKQLMWVAVFGGILATGFLMLINDRRLGLPSRMAWLAPLIGVVWIGIILLTLNIIGLPLSEGGINPALSSEFRLINRVVALVLAWVLLIPQRRRFDIFETGAEKPDSLWKPALGAIVAVTVLQFVVFAIAMVATQ
jgi:hypothetical protein